MITLEVPNELRDLPAVKEAIDKAFYWSELTGVLTIELRDLPSELKDIPFEVEGKFVEGIDPLNQNNKIKPQEKLSEFLVFQTQWGPSVTGRNYFHLVNSHLKGLCEIKLPYELKLSTLISDTWVGVKQIRRVQVHKLLADKKIFTYEDLLSIRPMKYIENAATHVLIGETIQAETAAGKAYWETQITILATNEEKSIVTWGPKSLLLQPGEEIKLLLLKQTGDRFWGWEYVSSNRPWEPLYTARTAGIESLVFKSLVADILLVNNPEFDVYKRLHFPATMDEAKQAWSDLLAKAKKEALHDESVHVDTGEHIPDSMNLDHFSDYQSEISKNLAGRFAEKSDTLDLLLSDVGTGKTSIFLAALKSSIAADKKIGIVSPTTLLSNQIKSDCEKMYGPELTSKIYFGCYGLLTSPPVDKYDILIVDETGKHDPEWVFGAPAVHRVISSATPPSYVLAKGELHKNAQIHGQNIARNRNIKAMLYNMEELPKQLMGLKDRTVIMLAGINVDPDGSWKNVITLKRMQDFFNKNMPHIRYGAVTGRQIDDMERFNKGELDVLISSNILESGINLKNAHNIWIVDAERFSLASIMQAKGRIIREWESEHHGECILFSSTIDEGRTKAFHGGRADILEYYTNKTQWTFAKELGIKGLPKNHVLNSNV